MPFDFQLADGVREVKLPARVVADDAETVHGLAVMGFGLMQAPRYRLKDYLRTGRLVEVLTNTPPTPLPLAVYYPQNRQLSPRVRVFVDWLARIFADAEL